MDRLLNAVRERVLAAWLRLAVSAHARSGYRRLADGEPVGDAAGGRRSRGRGEPARRTGREPPAVGVGGGGAYEIASGRCRTGPAGRRHLSLIHISEPT